MTTETQSKQIIKQGNGLQTMAATPQVTPQAMTSITAEDVKAQIEAHVQAILERMLTSPPSAEITEPLNWSWSQFNSFGYVSFQLEGGTSTPSYGTLRSQHEGVPNSNVQLLRNSLFLSSVRANKKILFLIFLDFIYAFQCAILKLIQSVTNRACLKREKIVLFGQAELYRLKGERFA